MIKCDIQDKTFSSRLNQQYFYDKLFYAILEDGNNLKYGDFCSRVLANGTIKVLKSLGLYKVTGKGETKQIHIHPKVLMIYKSTVADNKTISDTIIKMVDGYYIGIKKIILQNLHEFYSLKDDYPHSIDSSKSTYIIYNPLNDLYKIGKAKDVFSRLAILKNDLSCNLELIAWNKKDIEYKLHSLYKNERQFGEWFRLNNDDILDIKNKYDFTIVKLIK
jgi:hypothetical protein